MSRFTSNGSTKGFLLTCARGRGCLPSMKDQASQKYMRRRAGGKRSRSGCSTCRARHKKCDETPGHDTAIHVQAAIRSGFSWNMTSDERRCLSYFQYHTAPNLLDSLQIGQSEPAVYHAVVAFSALHEDYEAKGMPLPINLPHNGRQRFALDQLGRAFAMLTKRRLSQDPRFYNVTLLSCLVFILSDLLLGQYDNASTHHAGGPGGVVEQSLVPAVAHLDIMSAHFGVGGPLLCIDTELDHGESNFELPLAFGDPQDAHGAFKPVFSAGFRFITPYIHLLLNEILLNYEALHFSYTNLSRKEQREADLLELYILGLDVSLKTSLVRRNPVVLDCYTPHYWMILSRTEAFMRKYLERPSISIRSLELLWSWPHREGPFDSNWSASLAAQALKMELLALYKKGGNIQCMMTIIRTRNRQMPNPDGSCVHDEVFDELSGSPLKLLGTVKSMPGWSCVRAFTAFVSDLKT
ncbi:hypothetical protein BDV29DRAFT_190621 [Aspergillus leporis]|uniref:Zn(2)-C6 fungal-type domain-containing protein n=1 Tax=Aspergillus leporis TaxID=41062 RepID=A0A5N5X2A0_9EURO|nr:hypothetical protein BDV29DRAFT_190621 [Aspergillus leporis]